jgi:hypothetical protein
MATKRRRRAITRRLAPRTTNIAARIRKSNERHTMLAVVAAAALGYAEAPDPDDATKKRFDLPKVEALGTPGTYGLAAWAAGKFTKNKDLQHLATGLLSAAAYDLGKRNFKMSGGMAGVAGYGNDGDVIDMGFVETDD